MVQIESVPAFSDNYIWLIIQSKTRRVAIVDPGDAAPVIDRLNTEKLVPTAILITHHHPDHTAGVPELRRQFEVPVYGPRSENIPGRSHGVTEGDIVDLPDLDLQLAVMEIPGHTAGAIAYYGHGVVFVGDTLFLSGCGRLFEGTPLQMHRSLSRLAALPGETLVYCGHEYTLANLKFAATVEPENLEIQRRIQRSRDRRCANLPTVPGTIAEEKLTNPFLRTHLQQVTAAAERNCNRKMNDAVEVFAALRNWKDNFK
jgi:hydroxyacylglutathione hydrolase